jgi:hypothetical protein
MRESVAIALGVVIGMAVGIAFGMLLSRARTGLIRAGGRVGRSEVVRLQEEAAAAATRAREAYAIYAARLEE